MHSKEEKKNEGEREEWAGLDVWEKKKIKGKGKKEKKEKKKKEEKENGFGFCFFELDLF